MKDSYTILVSNTALPSKKIGSWTTRIDRFNKENSTFDYILSPNTLGSRYLYCQKRKFIIWNSSARKFQLKYWVAKDYLREIKTLAKLKDELKIVVMDDLHLLEAIVGLKKRLKNSIKIVFSFHGFELKLSQELQENVDKVLFLTVLGLEQSKKVSGGFLTNVSVVGNAVDSELFNLPTPSQKQELRSKLGIEINETVFIWMANDRPIKGLEMFRRIAEYYTKQHMSYKFLVIGNDRNYEDSNCTFLGKIPNNELGPYLQVGDYYIFTALTKEGFGLSLIEAYKCGNFVIAPATGAIPETLKGLPNHLLIDDPEDFEAWKSIIEKAVKIGKIEISSEAIDEIWPYHAWEKYFLNAIIKDTLKPVTK